MKVLYRAGLMLALAVVSAFAADSGSIRGVVTDPLGARVPNATVTLFHEDKQAAVTATDPPRHPYDKPENRTKDHARQ